MNLKLGMLRSSPGWNIILDQEGISYELITTGQDLTRQFSLLIVPTELDPSEISILNEYIIQGGTALFDINAYRSFSQTKLMKRKIGNAYPDSSGILSDIDYLEIHDHQYLPGSGQIEFFDSDQLVFVEKVGKGRIFVISFAIDRAILNREYRRKRFYFDRDELPSEIVGKISKGRIRWLVRDVIRYIFDQLDLPLIQKWYYPDKEQTVFIFRLDTDYCSLDQAENIYRVCKKNKIKASWFVDTKSTGTLTNGYAGFSDQEIGLHCDRHKVFNDYKKNRDNIRTAFDKLNAAGITPQGFASPYGEWNLSLAEVLEEFPFSYSSEFTLAYDDLPFFPYLGNRFGKILQIPVHPISPGRLRRSHFKREEMTRYYLDLIQKNYLLQEPIIIYHHPHHQMTDLLDIIFQEINERKIPNYSLLEFNDWWRQRIKSELNTEFDPHSKELSIESGEGLNFIYYRKEYTIVKKGIYHLPDLEFGKMGHPDVQPGFERVFGKSWREYLYDLESWRGKRKQ